MSANIQLARLALAGLPMSNRLALLHEMTGQAAQPQPEQVLRRGECARRLACSLGLIDLLARQGKLQRVRLPGRQRGHGFLESQVTALLAGKGGTP